MSYEANTYLMTGFRHQNGGNNDLDREVGFVLLGNKAFGH